MSAARPLVLLLSGPNLNLLGTRQPEIYGPETLDDHVATATTAAGARGLDVEHLQTNHEGVMIEAIHGARGRCAAIVVNAGAWTHYAWALHDALAAFEGPVVELHLSNPAAREDWRHRSVIEPVAGAVVAGFGGDGYRIAMERAADLLEVPAGPGDTPPATSDTATSDTPTGDTPTGDTATGDTGKTKEAG